MANQREHHEKNSVVLLGIIGWSGLLMSAAVSLAEESGLGGDHDWWDICRRTHQSVVGEREKSLRRDGYRSRIETGCCLALNSYSSLTPSVRIDSIEIKGQANASDGESFDLTYQGSLGPWSLEAGASIGHSEYRKTHPVFAKKRRASAYDLSAMITYAAPFGWSPVSLYTLAAYHRVEENITFFDSETWMAGLGVGITF